MQPALWPCRRAAMEPSKCRVPGDTRGLVTAPGETRIVFQAVGSSLHVSTLPLPTHPGKLRGRAAVRLPFLPAYLHTSVHCIVEGRW